MVVVVVVVVVMVVREREPVRAQPRQQLPALQPLLLQQQLAIPRLHVEALLRLHAMILVLSPRERAAPRPLHVAQQRIDAETDLAAPRLQIRRGGRRRSHVDVLAEAIVAGSLTRHHALASAHFDDYYSTYFPLFFLSLDSN